MLVDQERHEDICETLTEGERHIEYEKGLENALHRRDDCLICGEDRLLRHEVVVNRIYDEIV